jgi:hypothetical protein
LLTRQSSATSGTRMFVLLPLLVIGFTCFSKAGNSQIFPQKETADTYPGTEMEFSKQINDTTVLTDDETGEKSYQVAHILGRPIKINGKKIQHIYINENGMFPAIPAKSCGQFNKYLVDNLKPLLQLLDDGEYDFSPLYPTVNQSGQLAYYELKTITKSATPFPGATTYQVLASMQIDAKTKGDIDQKVSSLLANCPVFTVYYFNGAAMPYELGGLFIKIVNHKLIDFE